MKCRLIQKNMDRWLDGSLIDSFKREVELHVKGCSSCQKELEIAKTLQEVLRTSNATTEPSSDFDAVFWRKVYARSSEPWFSKLLHGFEFLIPIPNFSQAFVALTLAFFLGSAGGLLSVRNAQALNLNTRLNSPVQTLSGFQEFKGIPSSSVAGMYLTMIEERNLS